MRLFLTFTPSVLGRCDLTSGSRRELLSSARFARRTSTINHGRPSFIENKRYRSKPRPVGGMVNPKADSVYQTDAVLILVGGVQGRFRKRALGKESFNKTKQYRVRRCSKECLLRSLRARLVSAPDFIRRRPSKPRPSASRPS